MSEHEAECGTCYHGVSMHPWADGKDACTVPGCECDEFVDSEEEQS